MNTISLWQPWASAIEVGLKSIETRSWAPPKSIIGKPLAIAAAKTDNPKIRQWWRTNVVANPDRRILAAFEACGYHDWTDLPKGQVLCTTVLRAAVSTNDEPPTHLVPLPTDELFGNFSINRFAWFLDDRVRLKRPMPVVGRQGLFQWEPTA